MVSFDFIIKLYLITFGLSGAVSYGSMRIFHYTVWLLIIFFIHFKMKGFKLEVPRLESRMHYVFYFLIIWFLFSSFWCLSLPIWKKFFIKYVYGVFTVVVIIYYCRTIERFKTISKYIAILFVIEIFTALIENLTGYHLPASRYNPFGAFFGKPVIAKEIINNYVPTGFEWNPNNLGMKLACFFPFVMLYKKWWIKILGSGVVLYALVATGSKASVLGVILAVCVYFVLYDRKKLIYLLSAIILLSVVLYNIDFNKIQKGRGSGLKDISGTIRVIKRNFNGKTYNDSGGIRKKLLLNGWFAFKESNGLGIGLGSSIPMQQKYIDVNILNMHNYWFELLAEGGIIVFLMFTGWFLLMIIYLYKISVRAKSSHDILYFSKSFLLAFIAFIFACISPSSAMHVPSMWLLFGLGIAFVNISKKTIDIEKYFDKKR